MHSVAVDEDSLASYTGQELDTAIPFALATPPRVAALCFGMGVLCVERLKRAMFSLSVAEVLSAGCSDSFTLSGFLIAFTDRG